MIALLQRQLLGFAQGGARGATRLALIAHRGKPGREAAFPPIREALTAVLRGSQSPFTCVHVKPHRRLFVS